MLSAPAGISEGNTVTFETGGAQGHECDKHHIDKNNDTIHFPKQKK